MPPLGAAHLNPHHKNLHGLTQPKSLQRMVKMMVCTNDKKTIFLCFGFIQTTTDELDSLKSPLCVFDYEQSISWFVGTLIIGTE